jgi:V8-like Glu-specific endopeptidase
VSMSLNVQPHPLGFWGHPRLGGGTRIIPRAPAELRNAQLNLSGYPRDKCPTGLSRVCPGKDPDDPDLRDQGSTQWRSFGNVVNPTAGVFPGMMTYDLDTAEGHSGAPVWLTWNGFRNLVAINTTGFPRATAPFDIIANMGVRITAPLLSQLRAWMRADGVSATF